MASTAPFSSVRASSDLRTGSRALESEAQHRPPFARSGRRFEWLRLGRPPCAPAEARVGAPATAAQRQLRDRLGRLVRISVRLARGSRSDLGRSLSKFDATELTLHSLASVVSVVEFSFTSSSQIPGPLRRPDGTGRNDKKIRDRMRTEMVKQRVVNTNG